MPVVRPYKDEIRGEQGAGISERSTRKTLYCFDPNAPLTLYEWGGHAIPEAPEFTTQEPQPQMERLAVGGYNQTILKHVDDEYIQGQDYTVNVPERRFNMARLIVQVQRRTQRNFTFFTVPNDDCADACDYAAEFRGSGRLGEITETGAVVAYDTEGDGGAVTKTVMLRLEGASVDYDGIRIVNDSVTGLDPVYSVLVGSLDDCSDDSFCPYQVGYAFDSAGSVTAPAGTRYADKWGVSSSAIDGTALGIANIITSSVFWRGDVYVGYSDVFKATATAGGIARSIGGTAAFVDLGVTSSGIQALVIAGSRLHAFGEAGEWHYTDDGDNWVTVVSTVLGSTDLFCAAYNPFTKRIYVGGAGGAGFAIDGSTVISLSGLGSADLRSVACCGFDHIAFGTNDSKIYESFTQSAGGAFAVTKTFASGAVNVLLADKRSSNLVAACGSTVYQRSIMQLQEWLNVGNSPDASVILSGSAGYEEHREGTQYFVFGTTNGGVFEAQVCTPCRAA